MKIHVVQKAAVKKMDVKKAEMMHPYADQKPLYQALPEMKWSGYTSVD